VDPKKVAYIMN
jgi:hypothetical protein